MTDYYDMIFKRKSFHLFRNVGKETITENELELIMKEYENFDSFIPEIRTAIRIVPANAVSYYNRIDIGIYLLILELCLRKQGVQFSRELFVDMGSDDEYTKVACYQIRRSE